MEARSKRVPKKSAKLLSYEQNSKSFNKKRQKTKPGVTDAAPTFQDPPAVPKLKIKLSECNPPLRKSKTLKKDKHKHEKDIAATSKHKKHGKRKAELEAAEASKELADKNLQESIKELPLIPNDIEIDADDYDNYDPLMSQTGDSVADSSESTENVMMEEPDTIESNPHMRTLTTKLAEEETDTDNDMHNNKAAKFFETKKAEQKAASALSKEKAAKSGAKAKRNRMPTAYTMWCNSYRAKLQAQCPGMRFGAMNKKLGEVWWSIPLKEKNQWKRRAKRLATHGAPKNLDSMKYLGSKAIVSLQRNNIPITPVAKSEPVSRLANVPTPVYKITQTEPIDIAAYLQVMGDSLFTIGTGLAKRGDAKVQGSLTMLLDSFLSGVSSLLALTQQVPELDGDIEAATHQQRMADVAHFIPNL